MVNVTIMESVFVIKMQLMDILDTMESIVRLLVHAFKWLAMMVIFGI